MKCTTVIRKENQIFKSECHVVSSLLELNEQISLARRNHVTHLKNVDLPLPSPPILFRLSTGVNHFFIRIQRLRLEFRFYIQSSVAVRGL